MENKFYETLHELGFYEVSPKPSPEELSNHYKERYYQNGHGLYASTYTPEEIQYFQNVAKIALETVQQNNMERSLLDLGCGEGFFTAAFHSFGWKVSCSDFSEFGLKTHNKEMVPYFSCGDLYVSIQNYIAKQQKFGLLNLQHVLEHVLAPIQLLEDIKPLLGENAIVRVTVPNDYSDFQHALLAKGSTTNTWFSPPEHLSYFNTQSLFKTLEHCGYRVFSLQATFPIEVFLANPHANYWKDRSLGKGAHAARIFTENHLMEKSAVGYIQYAEAAAKLGFGRALVAYATRK